MKFRKEDYYIKPIPYRLATDIVVKHHYLHRQAPCSHAFGLFKNGQIFDEQVCGVIIYGTPPSSTLRRGICGDDEILNVIELTRLWVHDSIPKNGESYLVGNTLPLVPKDIVVSFADTSMNHLGVIYQATNWYYTGLSAKRTDWKVKGINKHSHTLADKYTAQELRNKYQQDFTLVDRPRKHRYIYFNTPYKWRKRELLKKLRYPILPYPKVNQ